MLDSLKQQPSGELTIDKSMQITLFPENGQDLVIYETVPFNPPKSKDEMVDILLPNVNSVAGPLVFLGASIIGTHNIDPVDTTKPVSALVKVLIDGFGILFYGVAMIVLAIIAFIRILYLWLFIVLSPFIILITCLESGKDNKIP
jgi:hypothetical protein